MPVKGSELHANQPQLPKRLGGNLSGCNLLILPLCFGHATDRCKPSAALVAIEGNDLLHTEPVTANDSLRQRVDEMNVESCRSLWVFVADFACVCDVRLTIILKTSLLEQKLSDGDGGSSEPSTVQAEDQSR